MNIAELLIDEGQLNIGLPSYVVRLIAEEFVQGTDNYGMEDLLLHCDENARVADWEDWKVHLPEEQFGEWRIMSFDIAREDIPRLTTLMEEGINRDPGYGKGFTKLVKDNTIWMSDTKSEICDHAPVFDRIREVPGARVLINGGGIGVLTNFAIRNGASRIDVVDIDPYIIDLHRIHYDEPYVFSHQGDARTIELEGEWDIVWHDIWPDVSVDNLDEMNALEAKYADRAKWQDCWGRQKSEWMYEVNEQFVAALQRGDWDEVKRIDPNF